MNEERIQKYISQCGEMSRRAAEKAISEGRVTVNGKIAEIGQSVSENDVVKIDGRAISLDKKNLYIMMYKPKGYVTTLSDEKDRKCVLDLLTDLGDTRVYPIGRLDMNSEGLLLFTNDGELTNKLTHPSGHVDKVYHVTVNGEVSSDKLGFLRSEMVIDGYKIKPVKTEIITYNGKDTTLRMTLTEGRNRQIRKMCEKANLFVKKLKRVAIGEINIGTLKAGKWKELSPAQIKYLKSI